MKNQNQLSWHSNRTKNNLRSPFQIVDPNKMETKINIKPKIFAGFHIFNAIVFLPYASGKKV